MRRAKALGAAAGDQLWLAWVLNADGRDAEALSVIDEALTREPRNAPLHAWRGLLLHALRRYDEEIVELRHAVSLDDRSWETVLHLGLGYSRRMQYDLALPALRRAVALSDTGGLSLAWLGRVSADAGDVGSAERIAAQLRALAPARGLSPSAPPSAITSKPTVGRRSADRREPARGRSPCTLVRDSPECFHTRIFGDFLI